LLPIDDVVAIVGVRPEHDIRISLMTGLMDLEGVEIGEQCRRTARDGILIPKLDTTKRGGALLWVVTLTNGH